MSKIITSPVKRWAGTVTLADPLTEAQALEIERALAIEKEAESKTKERSENFKDLQTALNKSARLPTILLCVEKWDLENFTASPFPFSPRNDSQKLIDFLFSEIITIYIGESIVPNE